ncbi:MAG TPA: ribbon-helix-helix protein, CopG family [Firmicutes bacterium]|nr:ribbon-helix-helix protein, CopG family [Bacillota bacterium]
MRPLKKKVSITLDQDIIEKLMELSEIDGRSLSQFINRILRDYLSEMKNKK